MRWTLFARATFAALIIGLSTGQAAEVVDRIAAIINDEAITVRDLDERVRMAIVLSQFKDTAEVRKRIIPQVLRKMIDEHLTLQEAKRFKINVSSNEVEDTIHLVEKQNGIPEGGLSSELTRAGIQTEALRDQFLADITWQHITSGMFQNTFKVSDDEVTERLETIAAHRGQLEYMVADILLLVDTPAQEEQTRNLGERLIEQLKEGAPFPVLASQFSQASTASNGGNMGWVYEGSIDDDLFNVVKTLTPGTVTKLIRAGDGFHIMALINRRIAGTGVPGSEADVVLSQMVLPIPAQNAPPKNILLTKAMQLVRGVKTCDEFERLGRKEAAIQIERTGPVKLSTLPQAIQAETINTAQGETAPAIEDPKGIRVMMMCSRVDTPAPLPPKDFVRRQIEDERLGMMSRRLMRDLHRSAFIDTRL